VARAAVACPAPVRAATCFLASPFFPRSSSVDPGFPVSPHHFTALVNPPPILSTHQHSAVPPEADGRARRGHDYLGGTAYVPSTARGITLLLRDSWCRSVPGRYMRVWLMGSTTPGVCVSTRADRIGRLENVGRDGRTWRNRHQQHSGTWSWEGREDHDVRREETRRGRDTDEQSRDIPSCPAMRPCQTDPLTCGLASPRITLK
jgi:hypothetical protein